MLKFQAFNKIARLSRDTIITEKIDGTNGQIAIFSWADLFKEIEAETNEAYNKIIECIEKYCLFTHIPNDTIAHAEEYLYMFAGSRKRWLDCSSQGDNYGFAKWVKANAEELIKLGEGRHYGEWYGNGIQRGYGLDEKRFALFNVRRWADRNVYDCMTEECKQTFAPKCCEVVPILYEGMFDTKSIDITIERLIINGSTAVEGFMKPEGIVIFHKASGKLFKKTVDNDEKPKRR